MEIFSIECFLAVCDCQSFTKAAKHVNRTQSAVTQQISKLEKSLGIRLFNRENGISLTSEGELFLSYALRIHGIVQEVLDKFKEPDLNGEVRVGIPEDFATLFLSDVLVQFSKSHPNVSLNVDCDLTVNLMNKFKAGMLDLVVVKMKSPQEFPYGVEIWNEPLVWVGHSEFFSKDLTKKMINLVLAPDPCIYRSQALMVLEKNNIPWKIVYTSPSYAGIIAAVKANMGVTVLPLTMIPHGLHKLNQPYLPKLPEIHVSLLKTSEKMNCAIDTLYEHILDNLNRYE